MALRNSPLYSGQQLIEDLYQQEVGRAVAVWKLGPKQRWFVVFEGPLRLTLDFSDEQLLWASQGAEPKGWLRKLGRDQLLRALFRTELRSEVRNDREHDLTPVETRLLSMVISSKEIHFEIGEDGTWCFLSPSWSSLTGNDLADTLSRPVYEFVHADDVKPLESVLEELFLKNAPGGEAALRIRTRSGEYRNFILTGEVRGCRNGNGSILVGGTLRDVTAGAHARHEAAVDEQIIAPFESAEPTH